MCHIGGSPHQPQPHCSTSLHLLGQLLCKLLSVILACMVYRWQNHVGSVLFTLALVQIVVDHPGVYGLQVAKSADSSCGVSSRQADIAGLIWSDEFDVRACTPTGVNSSNWKFQTGNGSAYGLVGKRIAWDAVTRRTAVHAQCWMAVWPWLVFACQTEVMCYQPKLESDPRIYSHAPQDWGLVLQPP